MRLRIEIGTAQNPQFFSVFNVILMLVETGRHTFDVERLRELCGSAWYKSLGFSDQELIRRSASAGSYREFVQSPTVIIDESMPTGGEVDFENRITKFPPLEALEHLMQPFSVILENEWFDGGFLLWMAKALNIQSFSAAYRRNRFQFRNAGGKDSLSRSAQVISNGVWPRPDGSSYRALRLWNGILLDRDAENPDHDPNKAIRDACEPHAAWVVELSHRSIENYLPHETLLYFLPPGSERARVHSFANLSEEQRKYYHMKKGFSFPKSPRPTKQEYMLSPAIPPASKDFFRSIDERDWANLAPGFGGGLSRIYVDEGQRPSPGRTQLRSQSIEEEMKRTIEKILRSI